MPLTKVPSRAAGFIGSVAGPCRDRLGAVSLPSRGRGTVGDRLIVLTLVVKSDFSAATE